MKKKTTLQAIQQDILQKILPNVPFDGWTQKSLDLAIAQSDYSVDQVRAAFPKGIEDVLFCFARFVDNEMLAQLDDLKDKPNRVRDCIKTALQTRLQVLQTYREAERQAVGFWALPQHTRRGMKSLWLSADAMWQFAGDQATDYNRYTKRGLLSAVLAKVTLYWLQDDSENYQETNAFIDRQIEQVLTVGKIMGKIKPSLNKIWGLRPKRRA